MSWNNWLWKVLFYLYEKVLRVCACISLFRWATSNTIVYFRIYLKIWVMYDFFDVFFIFESSYEGFDICVRFGLRIFWGDTCKRDLKFNVHSIVFKGLRPTLGALKAPCPRVITTCSAFLTNRRQLNWHGALRVLIERCTVDPTVCIVDLRTNSECHQRILDGFKKTKFGHQFGKVRFGLQLSSKNKNTFLPLATLQNKTYFSDIFIFHGFCSLLPLKTRVLAKVWVCGSNSLCSSTTRHNPYFEFGQVTRDSRALLRSDCRFGIYAQSRDIYGLLGKIW